MPCIIKVTMNNFLEALDKVKPAFDDAINTLEFFRFICYSHSLATSFLSTVLCWQPVIIRVLVIAFCFVFGVSITLKCNSSTPCKHTHSVPSSQTEWDAGLWRATCTCASDCQNFCGEIEGKWENSSAHMPPGRASWQVNARCFGCSPFITAWQATRHSYQWQML